MRTASRSSNPMTPRISRAYCSICTDSRGSVRRWPAMRRTWRSPTAGRTSARSTSASSTPSSAATARRPGATGRHRPRGPQLRLRARVRDRRASPLAPDATAAPGPALGPPPSAVREDKMRTARISRDANGPVGERAEAATPPAPDERFAHVAGNSMTVAGWTAVSRVTGLARGIAVAAVLGPTYLGNLFQAMYVVPALLYQMLAGSLFVALLVPVLVRYADARDTHAAQRIASGFLTATGAVLGGIALLGVVGAPLILRVFSVGVADPAAAAEQQRLGLVLLALMMPQLVLFAIAGTGAAVMNAHGRFAMAAGAPALENLGVVAVMGVTAVVFGTGHDVHDLTAAQVTFMGVGATAAVAMHAGAQWCGAARVGVKLLPRAGWRDAEVRTVLRRSIMSFGVAALEGARPLFGLPAANRVAGGVVAFQLAMNFASLPVALGAKPVGTALLPQLARRARDRSYALLHDDFV